MRIHTLFCLAGQLLAAASLAAQEQPKPVEKPKDPPKPAVDFAKFKFLEGCWRGQVGKEEFVEEHWTSPSENLVLSTTRYFTKERATGYDFNRIEWVDSTVVLGLQSKGKPEDVYTLKTLVNEYMVFENLAKKDFPQRVIYRLTSDGSLIPRLEGNDAPSVEVRFQRVKCPGQDKD